MTPVPDSRAHVARTLRGGPGAAPLPFGYANFAFCLPCFPFASRFSGAISPFLSRMDGSAGATGAKIGHSPSAPAAARARPYNRNIYLTLKKVPVAPVAPGSRYLSRRDPPPPVRKIEQQMEAAMARKGPGKGRVSQGGPAAGGYRPASPEVVRRAQQSARDLTAAAIGSGDASLAARALTARAEARVAERVARHVPADLEPSGPLPYGPARGGLVHVEMFEAAIDPRTGKDVLEKRAVRKRRGPSALAYMPAALRSAAEIYAGLVEAIGSPGGPATDAPRGGGVSDGGATSRCEMSRRLGAARKAIGDGVVRLPAGRSAHADRPRRVVTVRRLVDLVCLKGWSIRRVLGFHGWSRTKSYQRLLRQALEAALERIADTVA